jgi:hypothetical protein
MGERGRIDPRILGLGTSWRWVFSFTSRPLYLRGKSPRYLWDRTGLDDVGKTIILPLLGLELRPLVFQPVASRCTDYTIPDPTEIKRRNKEKEKLLSEIERRHIFIIHIFIFSHCGLTRPVCPSPIVLERVYQWILLDTWCGALGGASSHQRAHSLHRAMKHTKLRTCIHTSNGIQVRGPGVGEVQARSPVRSLIIFSFSEIKWLFEIIIHISEEWEY